MPAVNVAQGLPSPEQQPTTLETLLGVCVSTHADQDLEFWKHLNHVLHTYLGIFVARLRKAKSQLTPGDCEMALREVIRAIEPYIPEDRRQRHWTTSIRFFCEQHIHALGTRYYGDVLDFFTRCFKLAVDTQTPLRLSPEDRSVIHYFRYVDTSRFLRESNMFHTNSTGWMM